MVRAWEFVQKRPLDSGHQPSKEYLEGEEPRKLCISVPR